MAKKFLTDIKIAAGVYDSSGDIGNSGQVLSSTGSGVNWINTTTSASVIYQDGFTGNGSATAFTLANSIDNENKTQVYIDGVYQHKDNYSLSGTTLTFSTAPPNTSDIEVISFSSVSAADDILYDTDFASAGLMTTNGSGVYSITTNNSANWNTAYGWGDHGLSAQDKTDIGNLSGTNTGDQDLSSYATQSYVGTQISNLVDSSPATLNTLNELAAALGDDPNFATTTANSIGTKLPLAGGTLTGAVVGTSFSAPSGFINGSNGGIRIHTSGTKFFNITAANAARDNIMDIGAADARFKDLFLGGSITADGATFAGTVEISATIPRLNFTDLQQDDWAIINDNGEFKFQCTSGSGVALLLDTSNNATFAGTVETTTLRTDVLNNKANSANIIYRSGTSTLVGGGTSANKLYVLDNGNVGIGTTSPGSKLDVRGSGYFLGTASSGTALVTIENNSGSTATSYGLLVLGGGNSSNGRTFEVRDASGNTDLIVKGDGNVGIGTTSPNAKLAIGTTGGTQNIEISNSYIQSFNRSGSPGYQTLNFYASSYAFNVGNVGIGTTSPTSKFEVYGGNSGVNDVDRYIRFKASNGEKRFDFYVGGTGNASSLGMYTSDGTTKNVQIASGGTSYFNGGNVGIGTTSPSELLHLNKATGDPRIKLETGGGGDPGIIFQSANNRTGEMYFQDGSTSARFSYNHSNESFNLYAHNQTSIDFHLSETTTYFPTQNVGIGTTSPSHKLHVLGDQLIFGDLLLGGSANSFRTISMNTSDGSDNQTLSLCGGATASSARGGRVEIKGNEADGSVVLVAGNVSTGDIDFYTANTQRMIINNAGNIGIGTTSPAGVKFQTVQTTSGEWTGGFKNYTANGYGLRVDMSNSSSVQSALQVYTGAGVGFVVKNTGNVGIGNISPSVALDVTGEISSSDDINAGGKLVCANVGSDKKIAFRRTGANNFSIEHDSSSLYFYNESTTELPIRFFNNGDVSMIAGNVGIGTTSPSTKLHLYKNAGANTVVELLRLDCGENSHAAGKGGKIVFRDINVYNDTATIEAVRLSASSASTLNFRLRNSANGPILALRSDHIAQFQGTSTSDIIKINSGTGLNANVGMIVFQDNSSTYLGQITANSATTTTSYLSASDYRLKEDLKDFNGLDLVSNIKVYDFKWKAADERTYGVMAHELNEVIPQAVNGEKDAERMQSADYSKIVPVLVKAIQELKADNDSLKTRIETLENN